MKKKSFLDAQHGTVPDHQDDQVQVLGPVLIFTIFTGIGIPLQTLRYI